MSTRKREKFYEEIADDFERVMNPYDLRRRLEVMMNSLPRDLSAAVALDGGCGPGFFSKALAGRGASVVSADISPSLARIASARASSAGVVCDVAALPFDDESFDVVLSSECIEHTADPRASFLSLARVLRSGGTMILSVPNSRWKASVVVAGALGVRPYGGLENWVHPRQLRRWALQGDLRIVDHFGVHPLPFQLPLAPRWLPRLERVAKPLGMWMINQVMVGRKA